MYTLIRKQHIPLPVDEVFSFFQQPENLARITPGWLGFRILTPEPIRMEQGALIDYTIRWLGIRVRWTTLITGYDPPYQFVDQQLKGPYSLWHHTHTFVEKDGGTEMTDTVRYILPFGMFGAAAHRILVRRQLEEIFDFRAKAIGFILQRHSSLTNHEVMI